jgi:hypothetical protein
MSGLGANDKRRLVRESQPCLIDHEREIAAIGFIGCIVEDLLGIKPFAVAVGEGVIRPA